MEAVNPLDTCPYCDMYKVNCECTRAFRTTCSECGGGRTVKEYRDNGHGEAEAFWMACTRCLRTGYMVVEVPLWSR